MKRIISLISLICILTATLLLGGCGFIEEDTGMMIKEIKKTNEFEDGTSELTIYFTDDYYEPVKITIPPGKEGNEGNGIANITHEYDKENKTTHFTIDFSKAGVDDYTFDIPDGATITEIKPPYYDETTEKYYIHIILNGNEEEPVVIELPDFYYVESCSYEVLEDKSVDVTFHFNGDKDDWTFNIPAPQRGNGILDVNGYESEDGLSYCIDVTFTDLDSEGKNLVETLVFPKPTEPSNWTAYDGSPDSKPGAEPAKVGDFWFDTLRKCIYVRGELGWERIISFNDETSDPHDIEFYLNDGSTKVYTQISVNHGKYFSSTGKDIPVPTPDECPEGYEFGGWYTKADNINPNVNTPFTDLTPVNDDLKLYARWIPKAADSNP